MRIAEVQPWPFIGPEPMRCQTNSWKSRGISLGWSSERSRSNPAVNATNESNTFSVSPQYITGRRRIPRNKRSSRVGAHVQVSDSLRILRKPRNA